MSREIPQPEAIIEPGLIVVRIRMCSGSKGGANCYHHADVVVRKVEEATEAAEEGRIVNWRPIDKYDRSKSDYRYYELLGEIDPSQARKMRKPLTNEEKEYFYPEG